MKNNYGGYSPLTISAEILTASPKPVTQAWAQVQAAQKRYAQARDTLAVLEQEAATAPDRDAAAARVAVMDGKPIPAPTTDAAALAVEQKRREVSALMDHADDLESNFLTVLNDHREGMVEGFLADANRALADALAALQVAKESVETFTKSAACWNWARHEDGGRPPSGGYKVPVRGGGSVDDLLDTAMSALDREAPETMLAAEAEFRAAIQADSRRATPDGLVIDAAAYRAYS